MDRILSKHLAVRSVGNITAEMKQGKLAEWAVHIESVDDDLDNCCAERS